MFDLNILIEQEKIPNGIILEGCPETIMGAAMRFSRQLLGDNCEINPDLLVLNEVEKGGIEQIRNVIQFSQKHSIETGNKCIIIKSFERYSVQSMNAILKILEEPGQGTHIILLCSDRYKVLDTIRSRCFIFKSSPLIEQNNLDLTNISIQECMEMDFNTLETLIVSFFSNHYPPKLSWVLEKLQSQQQLNVDKKFVLMQIITEIKKHRT